MNKSKGEILDEIQNMNSLKLAFQVCLCALTEKSWIISYCIITK